MKAKNITRRPIRVLSSSNESLLVQPGAEADISELLPGFEAVSQRSSKKQTTKEKSEGDE